MANLATACCCRGLCEFNSALTLTISDVDVSYCTDCRTVGGGYHMEIQTLSVDGEYNVPYELEPTLGRSRYKLVLTGEDYMTAREYDYSATGSCDDFERDIQFGQLLIIIEVICATGEIYNLDVHVEDTSPGIGVPSRAAFRGDLSASPVLGDEIETANDCADSAQLDAADGGTVVAELAS